MKIKDAVARSPPPSLWIERFIIHALTKEDKIMYSIPRKLGTVSYLAVCVCMLVVGAARTNSILASFCSVNCSDGSSCSISCSNNANCGCSWWSGAYCYCDS